ncbi:hypothetical protein Hanom_Chr13g01236311 [Helianthus anomalus]
MVNKDWLFAGCCLGFQLRLKMQLLNKQRDGYILMLSKLSFWSLWFGQYCHFSPNLKLFTFESLWFAFCCHFSPKLKISHF